MDRHRETHIRYITDITVVIIEMTPIIRRGWGVCVWGGIALPRLHFIAGLHCAAWMTWHWRLITSSPAEVLIANHIVND